MTRRRTLAATLALLAVVGVVLIPSAGEAATPVRVRLPRGLTTTTLGVVADPALVTPTAVFPPFTFGNVTFPGLTTPADVTPPATDLTPDPAATADVAPVTAAAGPFDFIQGIIQRIFDAIQEIFSFFKNFLCQSFGLCAST